MDYTAKILKDKKVSYDNLDYTPIAIPTGYKTPETARQTMARIMLESGMISQADYHNMIGVEFDGDFTRDSEDFRDFETWEDNFKQSAFAEYEDNISIDNTSRLDASDKSVTEIPTRNDVPTEKGLTEAPSTSTDTESPSAKTE